MKKYDGCYCSEKAWGYIEDYCLDNAKKLNRLVDTIIKTKWANLPSVYYDDLYNTALDTLVDCGEKFDETKKTKFETFLCGSVQRKFRTVYRDRTRGKRCNLLRDKRGRIVKDEHGKPTVIPNSSLDTPVNEDGMSLCEIIDSNFNVESKLLEESRERSDEIQEYLKCLSDTQRKIAELIMNNTDVNDIKKILNLTDKQYLAAWKIMTSYEKKRIIRKDKFMEGEKMSTMISTEDMAETYKNTSYSIESISKQLQKKRIRDNHILQRYSGQWQKFAKSELVSDILRGKSLTQIIISEEIKDSLRMQWLIDGKQRCTTLDDFLHDGFSLSKNIKNFNIKYQTNKLNEKGDEILNEDGFAEIEFKEFDIRGKKFSQLPGELQDVFKDRQIPVLYNINCTKKDIADDIARFNRSKPMNKAQNGWLGLEENFAELVDNIAKMKFFLPEFAGTSYTDQNKISGAIRRIIVESIIISDFIENYNSDFNKMCEHLTEEASDSNFTEFYCLTERLTEVCNETVSTMFNVKDSFLWFGLFSRFANLNMDDNKFVDFMRAFKESISAAVENDFSRMLTEDDYNTYTARNTKDKSMVKRKIELLEKLMLEYLHIDNKVIELSNTTEELTQYVDVFSKSDLVKVCKIPQTRYFATAMSILDFVKDNIGESKTDEDVELYYTILEEWTLNIDGHSELLSEYNLPSMVGIVGYACQNECDIVAREWFIEFSKRNNTYSINQRENYTYMLNDLLNYIEMTIKKQA